MTSTSDTTVWFITGCSSGFGRAVAEHALAAGHRVVATARSGKAVEDLQNTYPELALGVAMDITRAGERLRAVEKAEARFGRIDVLVNNAGYGYFGAVEEGEDDAVRDLFDTNVFGLAEMTKLVLPGMRARRFGRIVNISSLGGMMAMPGTGYYCASKFAVEGLSEALAKEVEPLGIRVLIVEPGPFQTRFSTSSRKTSAILIADYETTAGPYRKASANTLLPGDPERAAKAIFDVVALAEPPLRLLLGKIAYERVPEKLSRMIADYRAWEAVSLAADHPDP